MPCKTSRKPEERLGEKVAKWEWRKRFRVWDANRKIFLYPENWMEPELRLSSAVRSASQEILGFICAECNTAKTRRTVKNKGASVLLINKDRRAALLVAQTLARELEINLYRIDLGSVVTKYIGETEKNLKRIFEAAERSGAVLFFDEADALFGKRTDVKDSHDRYANIEVNYLLKKIEQSRGLSLLSTSRRGNIDEPFLRRLRFVVSIPTRRKTPTAR